MTIFSQDDPAYIKAGKAVLFVCTSLLSLVLGFLAIGFFMLLLAEGPRWLVQGLVFLVFEPISKCLQLL